MSPGRPAAIVVLAAMLSSCVGAAETAPGVSERACPAGTIPVAPQESIQAAVDGAAADAAFCLKNGVHRMQVVRPKAGQRFYGEGRTVLNGSEVITAFGREGSLFVAKVEHTDSWRPRGACAKSAPGCDVPEGLFVDDQPFRPVPSMEDVAPGRFFLDRAGGRIYFADDPTGRKVEVSLARFAFGGTAQGVLIDNVIVEKYASVPQHGAIEAKPGWIVENCEVRLNGAGGIGTVRGTRIANCAVHHNGQIGIAGDGDGVTIEGNAVWANNTRGYDYGWEAGGIKLSLGRGIVMRNNHVYDNDGPGLWCDGDCRDTIYEGNTVEQNRGAGIYHEISYPATIRNNVLAHNGLAGGWFWGSQIIVAASEGVQVYGNRLVVGPGKCGIMLIDQGRDDRPHHQIGPLYKTRDNSVHDNDTVFEGDSCAGGISDVAPGHENYSIIEDGANRFDRNVYRVPRTGGHHVFAWGHAETDWDGARRLGFEPGGRLVPSAD